MFKRGKANYETDIRLGEKYRDEQTGIEGHATCVAFYQHGCERVTLEVVAKGKITSYGFDAPRLKSLVTGEQATTPRTGGPGDPLPDRRDVAGRGAP